MILEQINQAGDVKKIDRRDLGLLADEIRQFLISSISETGGHLASNLGVVELTIALHRVLDLPQDKLIWDVGHQSYTHKILTGRKEGFGQLRRYGGMSGFPKRRESGCDAFDTGHSSTSISAGLGFARARDLLGENYHIVSVIGDGSMTGGMAYEALNNAAQAKSNLIIVLNDNQMSISRNVGGLSTYLGSLRTADAYTSLKAGVEQALGKIPVVGQPMVEGLRVTKNGIKQLVIPGMFFEDLGIKYLGPVDGHDIAAMERLLQEAMRVRGPVVVHVRTIKGKGYGPAERHPERFHGAEPFDIETGKPKKKKTVPSYTDVFSDAICREAERHPNLVAVTAAMADGTGLSKFAKLYPDRFFDVGIAEGHAVTFAAGMAAGGLRPVVAVYSSFLQRGFDQIIHDVCIQNLPVVFAVDRAGLVGSDGETHQGLFDLSYLSMIPNLTVMAPKNGWELRKMLRFPLPLDGPSAIRYPRGEACSLMTDWKKPVRLGEAEILYDETDVALIAVGSMVSTGLEVRERLRALGFSCSLINARFVKPLDEKMLLACAKDHKLIVTLEENVRSGGFGERAADVLAQLGSTARVMQITLPDDYIEHGSVDLLRRETGTDTESIVRDITAAGLLLRRPANN